MYSELSDSRANCSKTLIPNAPPVLAFRPPMCCDTTDGASAAWILTIASARQVMQAITSILDASSVFVEAKLKDTAE